MINRNKYADSYNKVSMKQEQIMFKQMRTALNVFVRKYAKTYQTSVINLNEVFLLSEHEDRLREILQKRYKFIIPFFSKFGLEGIKDSVSKNDDNILIGESDELTEDYILANAASRSAIIAKTSLDKVRSRIDAGVKDGSSIDEIAASIRAIQLINTSRAQVIARTEVHNAANYSVINTARQAESQLNIKMVKEWVAVSDGRTRDTHAAIDGQTVDMDGRFNVAGSMADRPLDPSLPPEESINCRCTMLFREKTYN